MIMPVPICGEFAANRRLQRSKRPCGLSFQQYVSAVTEREADGASAVMTRMGVSSASVHVKAEDSGVRS
jgi:hypothetical protein